MLKLIGVLTLFAVTLGSLILMIKKYYWPGGPPQYRHAKKPEDKTNSQRDV